MSKQAHMVTLTIRPQLQLEVDIIYTEEKKTSNGMTHNSSNPVNAIYKKAYNIYTHMIQNRYLKENLNQKNTKTRGHSLDLV